MFVGLCVHEGKARCESVRDSEGGHAAILGMSLRNNFLNLPNKYVLGVYYVLMLGCWDSTTSKTHVCKGAGGEEGSLGGFYTGFVCARMQVNVCFL